MLPLKTRLTITQPPDVAIRAWRIVLRDAHELQGKAWVRLYSPRHFRPSAAARYGYRPRSPRYLHTKLRLAKSGRAVAGPGTPLVLSGTLRDNARVNQVRGFPNRAKITRSVPGYATFRPRGNRPNLAAEQFAVTADERDELSKILDAEAQRGLDAAPRKVVRIQL